MKHKLNFTVTMFFSALLGAVKKLNPLELWKNPVMFITEIGAIVTTGEALFRTDDLHYFVLHVAIWLWFTVLFANFAEAIAERRNQAQADALKAVRVQAFANKINSHGHIKKINAQELKKGDLVIVKAGEIIPGDGEIIEGSASINESAITGESEPVIRAAGTDKSAVTAGTKVLSDQITICISSHPGESFLDHMIHLIEGAERKKTPNEIALNIFLSGLTIIFLVMIVALELFGFYYHLRIPLAMQVALLICLIPTTIAGLLSAIGIAGINRLMQKNVLALSGQSIESAGDINTLLLDKTGTITVGNRQAHQLISSEHVLEKTFLEACFVTSLFDQTAEGRSIIDFIKKHRPHFSHKNPKKLKFIPFSAELRMSGADIGTMKYRKGSKEAIEKFTKKKTPPFLLKIVEHIAEKGGTPLLVASQKEILGVIFLKDVLKRGLAEQFHKFHAMGIKTVMITGDNYLTASAIAQEVGVGSFLAEASPQQKLKHLISLQKHGELVAMTGDGVNDAPALAQADVGVAMNSGSQAAKEAANMVDLDSHPSKLFQIIEIGKQMLMTRGALTTFSIANDLAKFFAILPAMLIPYFPFFKTFNLMHLATPESAVLSAVIFNAVIIIFLIPLAFRGVKLISKNATEILNRNLFIYGLGGIVLPFVGIKIIDMILSSMGVA